jgi:DNA repair exonuclease SbcCD ATPase subunit
MKIIQLHAENIKRLKAVDITPEDNTVVISGKNENGKSSVIDSIWLALQYRAASKTNPSPLRKGEAKGLVTLDIGDYIVTRRFTESDSTLEIRTPDGSKISSPQKLLDGMIGDLSFDPWEFARKNEQDQRVLLSDLLYNITGGKLNLADFDVRKQEAFDQRTDANREKKRLANLLANIRPPVDNEPTEEISIAALTASINDALNTNNKIVNLQNDNKRSQELLDQSVKEIARLQAIIADCENKIHGNANVLSGIDTLDVAHLQDQLKDIETNNRRAREIIEYRTLRTGLENVEKEIVGYNATMELIEIEKAEALEAAPLPVKGFTVNADGVRIINEDGSDVPFCQASAARRLKISLGIAMAANPTLRVIRIADGSLLDDESMAIVKEMATDKDFQVWIEYASRNTDDRIGVYIEDGKVA